MANVIIGRTESMESVISHSIEAGRHDARNHFDHHGPFEGEQCPANNPDVPYIGNITDAVVGITHMDADTFCGLARMLVPRTEGYLEGLDLNLLEAIDCYGTSVDGAEGSDTLAFMVGVSEVSKEIKFPRCPKEGTIEVTEHVERMLDIAVEEYIDRGKNFAARAEETYHDKRWAARGKVGMWAIGENNPFDPSRLYRDGFEVVIVYRRQYKSISIYCSNDSEHAYGGKTIAGIQFTGHPKACGSPRGEEQSIYDAERVLNEIAPPPPKENRNGWLCCHCGSFNHDNNAMVCRHCGG